MKKYILLLFLLAFGGTLGCGQESGSSSSDAVGSERDPQRGIGEIPIQSIEGEVLFSGPEIGAVHAVQTAGKYAVVADFRHPAPHIIDLTSQTYVGSLGEEGRGPGEFQGTWAFDLASHDPPVVWAYDLQSLRLTRVAIDSLLRQGDEYTPRMINFQIGFSPTTPRVLGDTVVVSPGFLTEAGRLAYLSVEDGSLVDIVGPGYPEIQDAPQAVLQHAFQSYLTEHPDGHLFALAFRYTDRLEILRPDGTLLHKMRGPEGVDPKFEVGQMGGEPARASTDETLSAYVAIAATTRRIYALYVGVTRGESRLDRAQYVHAYTWDGEPVARYKLSNTASGLSLSRTGDAFITTRQYPEPAIVRYPIPGSGS